MGFVCGGGGSFWWWQCFLCLVIAVAVAVVNCGGGWLGFCRSLMGFRSCGGGGGCGNGDG